MNKKVTMGRRFTMLTTLELITESFIELCVNNDDRSVLSCQPPKNAKLRYL